MLRKIKLYGKLAKFIGHRVLEADVATAAEAVRFLLANWPEAEAHMNDQHYRVSIGTYDIDLEELHHPAGAAPISFVPVVAGAGAVGRIIAGIALIALSFYCQSGGRRSTCRIFFWLCTASRCFWHSGWINCKRWTCRRRRRPTPNTHAKDQQDEGDPRKSFSFSGIQNVSRAGVPVPVVYGETLVGSVVISAGIDIVQVSA
jgi:predicted phage tail protein